MPQALEYLQPGLQSGHRYLCRRQELASAMVSQPARLGPVSGAGYCQPVDPLAHW